MSCDNDDLRNMVRQMASAGVRSLAYLSQMFRDGVSDEEFEALDTAYKEQKRIILAALSELGEAGRRPSSSCTVRS